jgi:hypothetical protein
MAIKLRGTSCNIEKRHWDDKSLKNTFTNDIVCGGISKERGHYYNCHYFYANQFDTMEQRCRSGKADSSFLLLTAVTLIAVGVLTYLRMKKAY